MNKMPKFTKTVCAPLAFFLMAMPAGAQVSEVRIGVSQFDENILKLGLGAGGDIETSAALNAEIIFVEPDFLKWAFTPQPYINGTLNIEGYTSFGGAGLLWRQTFSDKFYGDFSFGLVAHTGTTKIDTPVTLDDLPGYFERLNSEIEFGSRVLFREQITLGLRVNDDWAGEVFFEHLSNGYIFSDTNEGVDILGGRIAKRF